MMSCSRVYRWTAMVALLAFAPACQEQADDRGESSVVFMATMADSKDPGLAAPVLKALEDARAVVVTIEDASGAEVYRAERVELYAFGDDYLSLPLSLAPGTYTLTEMLVIDDTGAVIYAAPVEGSPLAYLVSDPVPISFTVTTDAVTTVRPEVVSTAERTPEDFGYVSFGVDAVEVLEFLIAAFVHDAAAGVLVPATADIEVAASGGPVLYNGSLAARTNTIRVPDGHAEYRVAVTRSGYARYEQTFTRDELAAYFDGASGGPLEVVLLSGGSLLVGLTEVASIPTNGARDWEHFQIGTEHYLVVANYHNNSTYNIASKVYRWNGAAFVEVQSIATNGAFDLEHFQIGTEHFLAVANYYNGSTRSVTSKVYRWNGAAFVEFQSIATNGAHDWEHFEIGGEHYLVVANHFNDSTYNIASKVYRWNGAAFVEVQSIATNGAFDWGHFEIGTEHYLAVANYSNDSTRNIASKVYRWNGTAFVELQSIATNGAHDWEHFEIGTEYYLAVANHHNDSTYNAISKVYRWNGAAFVEVQSIATNGAFDWERFEIGTERYLVVANHYNDITNNIVSKVYRWNGATFVETQSIATSGAEDWEHFQIGTEHYLAVANYHNGSTPNIASKIYRLELE